LQVKIAGLIFISVCRKTQIKMTSRPRYDPEENISRHSATDPEKCAQMAKRQGWELIGWEKTNDSILKVDCVFEGLTEFPPSPYEPEHEREE
jgi:hypothetical protein